MEYVGKDLKMINDLSRFVDSSGNWDVPVSVKKLFWMKRLFLNQVTFG